ncbi:hypothetical protein [Turneriella parva]|uniref:Uncharacterized protein n=1 Tax=Turneriella parva (strain ATCC BAA-1111 / DSM 21527 / NCTC 11395 / H) TaxID=869212 RepID=I4BBF4_TURPD|nr:hypothetical protein [Turneriella parva]AFM14611.1 hypothetical protein Turpa_3977 [Turneriella parva DSM 21527]
MLKMWQLHLWLGVIFTGASFYGTATPLTAAEAPAAKNSASSPVAKIDEREVMLRNLIDAGVLMLEGKAYEQFIQAFVSPEDRRRFEQAYAKQGGINYEVWGSEKGVKLLNVLKQISVKDIVIRDNKACYRTDAAPSGTFSFAYTKGAWYIENQAKCAVDKPAPTPDEQIKAVP